MSECRKITPSAIIDIGKLNAAAPLAKPIELFDIFGIITQRRTKVVDYGESLVFFGRFEAVVVAKEFALTPQIAAGVVKGDKAVFPLELERLIDSAFPSKGSANIEMGMRIGVEPAAESHPMAYVWTFAPLIAPSESSAVTRLREQFRKQA